MLTRPDELPDALVAEALTAGWGLAIEHLRYAPVGFGSHHWHVTAAGDHARWFVTVDDLAARRLHHGEPLHAPRHRLVAALSTAHRLHEHGLAFVIAPHATTTGSVVHLIGDRFAVAVYPHVEGTTHAWGPYPGPGEVHAVLALLVQLHRAPHSPGDEALADTLQLHARDALEAALAELHVPWAGGPHSEPARHLLAGWSPQVTEALRRYDALHASVARRTDRHVLTHGEPHQGNTIDTPHGVVLVDWDTALRAPPERDLWSLAAQHPPVLAEYTARTGIAIDDDALQLYRLRWPLTDIALYVRGLRGLHVDSADTRAELANLRDNLAALS